MMKKLFAILLILGSILTLASCNDADAFESSTGTTTAETTTDTSTTAPSPVIVETPPLTYEVKFIGANGKEFTPFDESMFFTDIVIYGDGSYSETTGDGYLAFYSVQNYIPLIADKIPTVTPDENAEIVITARDGVSFEEITAVDVYGEDYLLLAEDMTLAEVCEKGQNEWKGQLLYLYFDVGFHDTDASYSKSARNGYFVKMIFADQPWGIDVRFETPELGLTVPHKEMIYMRTYHEFGDGSGNVYVSNGPLMFYKTSEYLPQFAETIPTVTWNEDFCLVYSMNNDITYRGGEAFSVYDEDCTELAKSITREELIQKSQNEWKGKTVYLQFSGVFYHKISETVTEDISNVYFIKTTF